MLTASLAAPYAGRGLTLRPTLGYQIYDDRKPVGTLTMSRCAGEIQLRGKHYCLEGTDDALTMILVKWFWGKLIRKPSAARGCRLTDQGGELLAWATPGFALLTHVYSVGISEAEYEFRLPRGRVLGTLSGLQGRHVGSIRGDRTQYFFELPTYLGELAPLFLLFIAWFDESTGD